MSPTYTPENEAVLDEFGFADGCVNAGDEDALRMAEEIVLLRQALVFADGACVVGNGYGLADLYNETTHFQGVLARAGCHARGKFDA